MKRMLWVVLMMSAGATFISSIFPLYGKEFHMSSLEITLLFAVYAIILVPTLLIVGAKGSDWGLKRVLRISIWISIASSLLFIGSTHVWMLFAARILEGIAYGAFTGTASAFLLKQVVPNKIPSTLKLSGAIVNIGFGLGPAISGLIVQYLHVQPLRLPYWILIALLVISWVILELLPSYENPQTKVKTKTKISLGIPNNISSQFWSFIGLPAFMIFMLGGIVLSLIPIFVKTVLHSSDLSLPGLMVFMLLGVAGLMQYFPYVQNPVTRMRIGILCLAAGPWIIVASGETSNLVLLWAGMLIQGIGAGWVFQSALRFAGQLPKPEERPRVISAFYMCAYAGFIIPPIGVGVLTQFLSLNVSLVIMNSIAAVLVLYIVAYSFKFNRFYKKLSA
jgi:MFS family permease